MPAIDRRRRVTTLITTLAILIAAPLAVTASDTFNDVPDSNVHHDDITWLAENRVTLGCNPPDNDEYCPAQPVLRQQMASFMRRLAENQIVDAATALEANHAVTADQADHATTADAADTADTAVRADSADTAGDADTIDGLDSTDLLPGGTTPAGITVAGAYAMGGTASGATVFAASDVSFGYAFSEAPDVHFIEVGDPTPAACPGSPDDPQAEPGHLCIYERDVENAGARGTNGSGGDGTADVSGTTLFVRSAAAGDFWSRGTWAAGAPSG